VQRQDKVSYLVPLPYLWLMAENATQLLKYRAQKCKDKLDKFQLVTLLIIFRNVYTQEHRCTHRDGWKKSRLCSSSSASFVHSRRPVSISSSSCQVSSSAWPEWSSLQCILRLERNWGVYKHEILVSIMCLTPRQFQATHVVHRFQQVVESWWSLPLRSVELSKVLTSRLSSAHSFTWK
jgi:hypothetical protein